MKNISTIIFILILLIKAIYVVLSECDRNHPLLKNGKCVSTCSNEELNNKICTINNEIIKTQWLNNIIYCGDKNFLYINVITSKDNNLYCLMSSYPDNKTRIGYFLDNEGYGLFNKTEPKKYIRYENESDDRFESDISILELNNKEYILSLSHPFNGIEIYDFYESKVYFKNNQYVFGDFFGINSKVWPIFKLKSNDNKYIIGLIEINYDFSVYFVLNKVSFPSVDIINNPPVYENIKILSSISSIASCYDMLNNYFACFFLNSNYQYTMGVFSYNLSQKISKTLANGNYNQDLFFKCVHFFGDTGAFGYFSTDEVPIILFQFKKYLISTDTIEDAYNSVSIITVTDYYFNNQLPTLCDMIKIEDKKIFFVGISTENNILYIISIVNYQGEKFAKRIYSIKTKDLNDYCFSRTIRITMYKKFLVLGSSYRVLNTEEDKTDYSSLMFFSYPNTTDVNLDIINYLSLNNNIKIHNLTLELKGKYIIENNIFGYIYSGIQIITNCIDLEDIYLANLNNIKIENNSFVSMNRTIKLYIAKNEIYESFTCKFKYGVVVTEPNYSEYNKYPVDISYIGENIDEDNYFDANKKRYIGKYSLYYLTLKNQVTERCDNYCELCYYHNTNECIIEKECNTINFFNELCSIRHSKPLVIDKMINNIKNDIESGALKPLLDNIIDNKKKDLIIKKENFTFQITTTENQKNNNNNNNISTINLGICETILKTTYNIDPNKPLIIFKTEYFIPYSSIPIIGYEVFNPENNSKLDLSLCKDENIDIDIPVYIDEEKEFKHDPNSDYYQDECFPYTTENDTDILLNDRHLEFNDNNMSLCENNCKYKGYEKEKKTAKCECKTKTQQFEVSEIVNKNDLLYYNNFTDQLLTTNMITMKCYYTLFTKDGILKNIGCFILIFTIIIFSLSGILFYKCGYPLLENDIKEIIEEKHKKPNNSKPKIQRNVGGKKKKMKSANIKKGKKNKAENEISLYNKSMTKLNQKNKEIIVYTKNNKNQKKEKNKTFYDFELNKLPYIKAIKLDKRSFFTLYISLLKENHPLIFAFFPKIDYNSIIIRIDLFFLSFNIYYFVNTLFFNESTIHKIYEEKGIYNFSYFIPQIIYSFFISYASNILIKFLSLSHRLIYQLKIEKSLKKANDKEEKIKKILILKYILFFLLGLIYLIFLWYYISSFSAVYQNTQIYLMKNVFISFSISLLHPFITNLVPSLFRILSLKSSNSEILYKSSIVFEYL